MSPANRAGGCGSVAERLPELALGIVGGTERADVLAHLDRCSVCRDTTAGFAATVDVLPTLLEEAEPPAGFQARTLERMRAERDRAPRRSRWTRVLTVAALVAAVMIASIAAVRIIDARGDSEAAADVTVSTMIGKQSRHDAGRVVVSSGDERYLWLDVDYGDGTGTYRLETVDAANQVTVAGTVKVADGRGVWGGVIHGPRPTRVRLVGDDGRVWCIARIISAS